MVDFPLRKIYMANCMTHPVKAMILCVDAPCGLVANPTNWCWLPSRTLGTLPNYPRGVGLP